MFFHIHIYIHMYVYTYIDVCMCVYIYIYRERERDISYRYIEGCIPPENTTHCNISFQSTKSGAGEQFLLLDCRARACAKGMFFSQTPVQSKLHGSGILRSLVSLLKIRRRRVFQALSVPGAEELQKLLSVGP